MRRAVQGFAVTDETIQVDLIRRVGNGDNSLSEMDTAMQFRNFLNLSPFFSVHPWSTGSDTGLKWEHMALERARELLANEVKSPLTDEQIREVDEIVAEAEGKLREQGNL